MRIKAKDIITFCLLFLLCSVTVFSQQKRKPTTGRAKRNKVEQQKEALKTSNKVLRTGDRVEHALSMERLRGQTATLREYLTTGASEPRIRAQEWQFIKQVLESYYEANKSNLMVAPFADTMRQLFYLSYPKRQEAGGFAGDFVRETFLFAALNIVDNWDHWQMPLSRTEVGILNRKLNDCGRGSFLAGLAAMVVTDGDAEAGATTAMSEIEICELQVFPATATGFVGSHHFDEHLAPAFFQIFRREFSRIAKATPDHLELVKLLEKRGDDFITEHKEQLVLNVEAYDKVDFTLTNFLSINPASKILIKELIPDQAANLRDGMLQTAIVDLRETGEITADTATQVLSHISKAEPGAFTVSVGKYINTRLLVPKGENIYITATGTVTLGFSDKELWGAGPNGIESSNFDGYSVCPQFHHGALLGRILSPKTTMRTNQNEDLTGWHLIGSSGRLVAENSGVLELRINDGDASNNSGKFDVRISK